MLGQGLEDHRQVGIALAHPENGGTAHAVQGFEDDIAVLPVKGLEPRGIPAHQHRRAALGKECGKDFFVAVPQALAAVDHQRAPALGGFKDVGGINIFIVEGRVLAHQDHVEVRQVDVLRGLQVEPGLRVVEDRQAGHARPGHALFQVEVARLHVMELPVPRLGGPEHGQGTVLLVVDVGNGVHDDPQLDAHGRGFLRTAKRAVNIRKHPRWRKTAGNFTTESR